MSDCGPQPSGSQVFHQSRPVTGDTVDSHGFEELVLEKDIGMQGAFPCFYHQTEIKTRNWGRRELPIQNLCDGRIKVERRFAKALPAKISRKVLRQRIFTARVN